jgi:hypothetical protein
MLTKYRYAKNGSQLTREELTFKEDATGYALAGESGTWAMFMETNPIYLAPLPANTSPYDVALVAGALELTEAEYNTEVGLAKAALTQSIADAQAAQAALPAPGIDFSDDDKIFLIDYYGPSYQTPADKRQWFNVMFRFDPVDDDPRN